MIKRLFTIIAIFSVVVANAQDNTSSPYSFYGTGLSAFNGSAENRAMGGLSIRADSIHYNFENPAALGALQLTTYTVGVTQGFTSIEDAERKEDFRNTSFDYLAVAIPTGRLNFAFGLTPFSSVGYKIEEQTSSKLAEFEGRGGINNLFLAFGYRIKKGLRVGIEGSYNFGKIRNKNLLLQDRVQYGSREKNRANLSGFSFKLAAQYEAKLNRNLTLTTSASYRPEATMKSNNTRQLATIALSSSREESIVDEREIDMADKHFNLPSDLRVGAGIGKFQKWFVGVEYEQIGKNEFKNSSLSSGNFDFKQANVYRIGGLYIPKYNDINSYFNRITFRAGLRYQELGLQINNQNIDEFGISFGMGLPAGDYLSNINLGIEYGQRGTTSADLVKESFFNVFVGISLNDRWFIKRKYH